MLGRMFLPQMVNCHFVFYDLTNPDPSRIRPLKWVERSPKLCLKHFLIYTVCHSVSSICTVTPFDSEQSNLAQSAIIDRECFQVVCS